MALRCRSAAPMEMERLGAAVLKMLRLALPIVAGGTKAELKRLKSMDNDVDALHGAIITYLGQLSMENLSQAQSEQLHDFIAAANYIENIGDMVETNLYEAGIDRLTSGIEISASTRAMFTKVFAEVETAAADAIAALTSNDPALAGSVLQRKDHVAQHASQVKMHLARRLTANEPNRMEAFRLESDIVENVKRIYYFAKRIAKLVATADMAFTRNELEHTEEFTRERAVAHGEIEAADRIE